MRKNRKIGVVLIVLGLAILAGSSLVYLNPTLRHRASLAIARPEKAMTVGVQESSESEIPVIIRMDVSPMIERKPGALAVSAQREKILAMARPLSVAYGLEIKDAHPLFGMISGKVPINNRQALYQDPRVLKVARDRTVRVPSEPVEFQAEYMSFEQVSTELNLENLWEKKGRGKGVSVAILDSGVDQSIVDVENAWGVGDYPATDSFGHGTMVAGVVSRTSPLARIFSLRVLGPYGQGKESDIIKGLERIVSEVPRPIVVNMSLGASPSPAFDALSKACEMAETYHGVTIVCASGNTSGKVLSPASSPATIAVGALNAQGKLAKYSSYGDKQTCVSFGDITATGIGGQRESVRGTSFSSPQVTAMISDVLSSKKVEDVDEKELMKDSTIDLGTPGKDEKYGYGLVSGGPMSTAPVSEEKPMGGLYPILATSSVGLMAVGAVIIRREEL